MSTPAEEIQRGYYVRTASQYDDSHMSAEDDEHYAALAFMDLLSDRLNLATFLDVGAGTGRGVRYLLSRGRRVRGVEPVTELIEQGQRRGIPSGLVVGGSGYALPFQDKSFDAAFECGVLHHVASPARVIAEMTRVASRAVFISDSNRFGQGRYAVRLLKLLLYKTHLWRAARFLQTRGKTYTVSEGDGLAYSYSVFDSYDQLAQWASTIWLIPTSGDRSVSSWLSPLLTAPHVLLCAIRDGEAAR
ncbi:MAG: class I SAM-dependent methyltransferase [Bryobacteraceae bacterium]